MARVFVSHAGDDGPTAAEVHRWLTDDGHEVFLDQHMHDGIAVGEDWERRLHERLRWADAMVCVITSAYVASAWCAAEVGIACSRGSRVLPVRAEPGVVHPLLRSVQQVDATQDPEVARARLLASLRRLGAGGETGWSDGRSPFPGLRPFEVGERRLFFGRSAEIGQIAERLRSPAERAERAVLLIVGPSGCGKSSLVRAGLLPMMAEEHGWRILAPIVPGTDPVSALVRELAAAAREVGLDWTMADTRRRLDADGLAEVADELLLAAPERGQRLLVVIDQFEELLTQAPAAERARFAGLLRPALAGPVQTIATLRPEFLDRLLVSSELSTLPTRTHMLRPLSRAALREVIEEPAELAGIRIGKELVDRLVADTGSGAALPLLAFTLAQLAEGVSRGGELSSARYDELGGVQGALTSQADAALAEAAAAGGRSRPQVIGGLLRLVTVDEDGRPTRWRVLGDELPAPVTVEVEAFVRHRLLTTDTENGAVIVEVAHEAFLSAWQPLAAAIAGAATALQARRAVERAAAEWDGTGRRPDRLWERGRLAAALADTGARVQRRRPASQGPSADAPALASPRRPRWWPRHGGVLVADRVDLSDRGRTFLHASLRRDRLRRARAVTVLSGLLVLALTAAGIAIAQLRTAQERQLVATARQLVAQADSARPNDPRAALLLGIAAQSIHPDAGTQSTLVNALTATRYAGTLAGHTAAVRAVAFAPGGRLLATGGSDGNVLLWDLTDPAGPRRVGAPLTSRGKAVNAVAFSPDSRTLATGGQAGTVLLWDVTDPAQARRIGEPLTGHSKSVGVVRFLPGGRILATGDDDDTVILWEVTDSARPHEIGRSMTGGVSTVESVTATADGHLMAIGRGNSVEFWDLSKPSAPRRLGPPMSDNTDSITTIALAPDGAALAVGTLTGVVLWDLSDRAHPRAGTLAEPLSSIVYDLAFSPDGHTLAAATGDETTVLWDVTDPARCRRLGPALAGHRADVLALAFAPDGRTVATGSQDNTVMLWDLTGRAQPRLIGQPLAGASAVQSVAFAPDGRTVALGTWDGVVLLWDVTDPARPRRLGEPLTGHGGHFNAVAFAPDGRILAGAGDDKVIMLWDVADPTRPRPLGPPLAGHGGPIESLAFAPVGRTLASGGDDRAVLLWDVTDPTRARRTGQPLTGHGDTVNAVAFTADGRTLASGGNDRTLRLWDVTDPGRAHGIGQPLTGHTLSVQSVAFGGRILAGGGEDKTVILWDIADLARPRRIGQPLTGPAGSVAALAFSPDGHTLAANATDDAVILWDVTDLNNPRHLGQPLTGPVTGNYIAGSIAFAPQGRTLLAGGLDDTVQWDLTPLNELRAHAVDHACAITKRGLERDEWSRYVSGVAYRDTCPG